MKKKVICLVVWIALTIFYVWSLGDAGRSFGAKTQSAYEDYVEYYTNEYNGLEGVIEGTTDAWSYNEFDNLESNFKSGFIGIAVQTVIYVGLTIVCYHFSFSNNKNDKAKKSSED